LNAELVRQEACNASGCNIGTTLQGGNSAYVKQKHLAALWQLERGIQPPPPETIEQAEQQIGDRLERDRLMHASALHSSAEFSPEAVDQIVGQRPIPAQERAIAQRRLEAMQKDEAFRRRYLSGDRQAALEYKAAAICARGMPVGTLDQIRAWEAAHKK
jgi:hypothetical protein